MEIAYLVLGFAAVAGLFYALSRLLGRTSRNEDSTHGGGMADESTGGSYGAD
jgi:hypothetical protein